jgi:AcrR family transcriptional regulator
MMGSRPRLDVSRLRTDAGVPKARLAASQLRRHRRIVDAVIELAEKGGFEGVRLRDVAEVSEVALGTLYKYFRSKEDILLFALTEELEKLETAMATHPVEGKSALARVTRFFERATRGMTYRPRFARAMLRAMVSGDVQVASKVATFHSRMTRLIIAALRDKPVDLSRDLTASISTERERQVAFMLQNVWFAALVGWAGSLHPTRDIAARVKTAAALMHIKSSED